MTEASQVNIDSIPLSWGSKPISMHHFAMNMYKEISKVFSIFIAFPMIMIFIIHYLAKCSISYGDYIAYSTYRYGSECERGQLG